MRLKRWVVLEREEEKALAAGRVILILRSLIRGDDREWKELELKPAQNDHGNWPTTANFICTRTLPLSRLHSSDVSLLANSDKGIYENRNNEIGCLTAAVREEAWSKQYMLTTWSIKQSNHKGLFISHPTQFRSCLRWCVQSTSPQREYSTHFISIIVFVETLPAQYAPFLWFVTETAKWCRLPLLAGERETY